MLPSWSTMSRAQRNASYDNNAVVPNSAELIAARNAAAKAYRAANPQGLDVAYGPGPRNKLDLFPGKDPASPCLVFIHGGYWQRNSREDFAHYAAGIRAHGWSAVLPSYSLAPDVTVKTIVEEIHQALTWVKQQGPKHGVGAGRIILSGWSAGAQLTAMGLSHPAVSAGVAMSGVYELGPIRDTGLNDKLKLSDEEIETLSPLRLPVVMKPMAITYGSRELPALVRDARKLHAKRSQAHAAGALIPIPNEDHFTVLREMERGDGQLVKAILAVAEG